MSVKYFQMHDSCTRLYLDYSGNTALAPPLTPGVYGLTMQLNNFNS